VYRSRVTAQRSTNVLASATLLVVGAALLIVPLVPPVVHGVQAKTLALALFASLGLGLLLLDLLDHRQGAQLEMPRSPATVGMTLVLVAAFLGIHGAKVPQAAQSNLIAPAAMLTVYFITLTRVRDARAVRIGIIACLAVAAGISVLGLVGFLRFRADVDAGLVQESARSLYLATPLFEHSYIATMTVLPAGCAAIGMVLLPCSARLRASAVLLSLPIAAYCVVVLSRSIWLASAVGLSCAVLLSIRTRRIREGQGITATQIRRLLVLAGVAVLAVGGAAFTGLLGTTGDAIEHRVLSLFDSRFDELNWSRPDLWQSTLRIAADHAPFGAGTGNFAFVIGEVHSGWQPVTHAHNQLLHTLTENGPVGAFGLVLALLAPLVLAVRATRQPLPESIAGPLIGLTSGLIALAVIMLFESPLSFASTLLTFAAASGALIRLCHMAQPEAVPVRSFGRRGRVLVAAAAYACAVILAVLWLPPKIREARAGMAADASQRALEAGDVEHALQWAELAAARAPHVPGMLTQLAEVHQQRGDLEAVLEVYRLQSTLTPGVPDLAWLQGLAAKTLEQYSEAADHLRRARRHASVETFAEILVETADCLHRAHRFEEARLIYQELLNNNVHRSRPNVLRRLAECMLNLRRDQEIVVALLRMYRDTLDPGETAYVDSLLRNIGQYYNARE